MSKQTCRCPRCNKRLCDVTLIGDLVIIETWCKNCKQLVDVVVRRQEAPAPQ